MANQIIVSVSPIDNAFAIHYAAVDAAQAPFVDAALADTSEAAYQAAVGFETASQLERLALTWLRKGMREKLDDTDFDRWVMMYGNALAEATDSERELLELADVAIEGAMHSAVH